MSTRSVVFLFIDIVSSSIPISISNTYRADLQIIRAAGYTRTAVQQYRSIPYSDSHTDIHSYIFNAHPGAHISHASPPISTTTTTTTTTTYCYTSTTYH